MKILSTINFVKRHSLNLLIRGNTMLDMNTLKFVFFTLPFCIVMQSAQAKTVYIDNTLNSNCLAGAYSISNRSCSGTDGDAYPVIQDAINSASVGDVLYMRGGTYNEVAIDIPESKNGTAWTNGNYTTLMSYPGEWAIVDATGLNTSGVSWTQMAVFTHPYGYGVGEASSYTSYWKFSNFEVTGGRTGFFLKADHIKWHYMYIHDNGRVMGSTDSLIGGIVSVGPRYAEIKYSYFKDNIQTGSSNRNNSNILFDSDYKDNNGNGGAFNENAATHSNEIAYNYFEGSKISLRQKNQQRFGYNDRDPNDMTYSEYGDKWHHNIILDADEAIGSSQDFIQIYNNITDTTINVGRMSGADGDVPIVYNAVVYNNTVKRDSTVSSYASFTTSAGYDVAMNNFYDVKDGSGNVISTTVHENVWFYNNIADRNTSGYQDYPFMLHWNMPANTTEPSQDNSDVVVERNLIHDNAHSDTFVVGHNYDSSFTLCDYQAQDVSGFNACSEIWRNITGILNWDNNVTGLYTGTTGANQYITDGTFMLDGTKSICTGGKSGNHPYLAGVTLPTYVGATNPNNNGWVFGVLNQVTSTDWLKTQAAIDPTWIEENGSQSSTCKAPPKPPVIIDVQ